MGSTTTSSAGRAAVVAAALLLVACARPYVSPLAPPPHRDEITAGYDAARGAGVRAPAEEEGAPPAVAPDTGVIPAERLLWPVAVRHPHREGPAPRRGARRAHRRPRRGLGARPPRPGPAARRPRRVVGGARRGRRAPRPAGGRQQVDAPGGAPRDAGRRRPPAEAGRGRAR